MATYHLTLKKGHDLNQLIDGFFEDVECNLSEMISFYDTSFLVDHREELWMPWDFKFEESRDVACLAFDSFAFIKVMKFFEMRSLSLDHMLEYTMENPEVIGLTISFCMCRRDTEVNLMKNEISNLKDELSETKKNLPSWKRRRKKNLPSWKPKYAECNLKGQGQEGGEKEFHSFTHADRQVVFREKLLYSFVLRHQLFQVKSLGFFMNDRDWRCTPAEVDQEYHIALGGSKHASLQPTTRFGRGKASYSLKQVFAPCLNLLETV